MGLFTYGGHDEGSCNTNVGRSWISVIFLAFPCFVLSLPFLLSVVSALFID